MGMREPDGDNLGYTLTHALLYQLSLTGYAASSHTHSRLDYHSADAATTFRGAGTKKPRWPKPAGL